MIYLDNAATSLQKPEEVEEEIKSLEAQGVEIRTCGTCLNFYGLTEKLQVGDVTNMYDIAERMSKADRIIKP